jgi:pimeloyl-ACP methyl ester carboxylesterase
MVASTARGLVEYADVGEGPVVLSLHGSFGGWDYGVGMAAFFAINGFRVIAPSRRGYLGSPLETGISFDDQADTMAALLDVLGIERVTVMGFSIGGPPAYLLAARHPDRIRALVAVHALCTAMHLTRSERMMWRFADHRALLRAYMAMMRRMLAADPARPLTMALAEDSTLSKGDLAGLVVRVLDDPMRSAFAVRVLAGASLTRTSERFEGQREDDALMLAMGPMDLSDVTSPTLLVGGTADKHRAHVEHAARTIEGSEVRWITAGTHRGLWLSDDFAAHQAYVLDWVTTRAE